MLAYIPAPWILWVCLKPWSFDLHRKESPIAGSVARESTRADDSGATSIGASCSPCGCHCTRRDIGATSLRRSIWYGLMMVDRFWETILYWQGMQQCTVVWWYCDVFICFWCDIYVWPCDWCASDLPGLQDIILAKLGAEFLEPPRFNPEKAIREKNGLGRWRRATEMDHFVTGKFPKIGFRPSKKRTSNEKLAMNSRCCFLHLTTGR